MKHRKKKSLGQHFLKDLTIAEQMVKRINFPDEGTVVEVGPGEGVLTQFLLQVPLPDYYVVELDDRLSLEIVYRYPRLAGKVIHQDILQVDFGQFNPPVYVIGNFPYNISTEIIFKAIDNRNIVCGLTGMFQKEVAERLTAPPGSKIYGVTSVLTQAWYKTEYIRDVSPSVFDPPPKVWSGIIQLQRNSHKKLNCDESLFRQLVKTAFNQRRKMLRNTLKSYFPVSMPESFATLRPEQLGVDEFITLTNLASAQLNNI